MAMLYIDGFDTLSTLTLPTRWAIEGGTWTVDAAGGRGGGGALVSSGTTARLGWAPPSPRGRLVVGFAFKLDADVTSGQYRKLCQFVSDGAPGMKLGVFAGGGLRLSTAGSSSLDDVGGSPLCEAAGIVHSGIWYHVEVVADFAASLSAGALRLYLFGTEVASSAGGASGGGWGGWTAADTFEFAVAGSSTANVTYDDLYVLDPDAGSTNVTPRGDCRVRAYRPNGTGAHVEFTPQGDASNYNCVNEVSPDADATYVHGDAVGLRDCYPLGVDFVSDDVLVHAMQFALVARKVGTGGRTIKATVHTGSGDHDSPTAIILPDAYATALDLWEQDPDLTVISGGSVAAAQFGFTVAS